MVIMLLLVLMLVPIMVIMLLLVLMLADHGYNATAGADYGATDYGYDNSAGSDTKLLGYRLFLVKGELRLEYVHLQGGMFFTTGLCHIDLAEPYFFCGGHQIYVGDGIYSASRVKASLYINKSVQSN